MQLIGKAPGAKVGGVVQQVARKLHVEALPADIPEHIEVDISRLELGDALRLQDVAADSGVTFSTTPPTRSSRAARARVGSPRPRRPRTRSLLPRLLAESAAAAEEDAPAEEE